MGPGQALDEFVRDRALFEIGRQSGTDFLQEMRGRLCLSIFRETGKKLQHSKCRITNGSLLSPLLVVNSTDDITVVPERQITA